MGPETKTSASVEKGLAILGDLLAFGYALTVNQDCNVGRDPLNLSEGGFRSRVDHRRTAEWDQDNLVLDSIQAKPPLDGRYFGRPFDQQNALEAKLLVPREAQLTEKFHKIAGSLKLPDLAGFVLQFPH